MCLWHAVCALVSRPPVRLASRGKRLATALVVGLGLVWSMSSPAEATLAPHQPQLYFPSLQTEPLSLTYTRSTGRPQHRILGLFHVRLGEGELEYREVQLTSEIDRGSTWSPDGQHVLVVNQTELFTGTYRLTRLNADGSNRQVIYECIQMCQSPAWSPRGDRIAFSMADPETFRSDIYLIDADGGNLRQFTADTRDNQSPSWSPDATMLAFDSTNKERTETIIYVTDLEGEIMHTIVGSDSIGSDSDSRHPTWSPDGERIAFSMFSAAREELEFSLQVFDLNSASLSTIISGADLDRLSMSDPVWSPDGQYIAFQVWTLPWSSGIAIIQPNGEGFQRVTGGIDPAWKP